MGSYKYKAGYAAKFLLLLSSSLLLSASYGHSEPQTLYAVGVMSATAYKVPDGEKPIESVPEKERPAQDKAPLLYDLPLLVPKCQEPEYGGTLPFPGAMVTFDNTFFPVKGRAKWLANDPGPAGKTLIEGIDSDNDCVRDDIENHIAQKYPNKDQQKVRKYLFEIAKYLGLFLQPSLTRDQANYYSQKMYIATECARRELGSKPTTTKDLDLLFAKFHNTLDRSYRYIHNNELLGGSSLPIPEEINCSP